MPIDINVCDATGQSALYLACVVGNVKLIQYLIEFKVKATRVGNEQEITSPASVKSHISPARKRISDGIQSIMSRLNLKSRPESLLAAEKEKNLSPIDVNQSCGETMETALQLAVRESRLDIITLLLNAGADPNIASERSVRGTIGDQSYSTCLMEACRNHDASIVSLLLSHGARDDLCRAQSIAVRDEDYGLTAKLLSCRSHADPEMKLNKKAMTENLPRGSLAGLSSLTYSSVFPNTPVMVIWHGQHCPLPFIKTSWLTEAAIHLNPKLRLNPKNHDVALYAITRLDVSSNALTDIPIIVFQLPSLRHLNLSQNKLEKLPFDGVYNLPTLEELSLQNNRLENVPDDLFGLPKLSTADLSNNHLSCLPPNLWTAPSLKELNVSFNLLSDLPSATEVKLLLFLAFGTSVYTEVGFKSTRM